MLHVINKITPLYSSQQKHKQRLKLREYSLQ